MELLISKLAKIEYADNLIVKDGFLLTSSYGLENRATGDLDFTVKGIELKLLFTNNGMKIPFNVDLTTGEDLIQMSRKETIKSIFTDEEISITSYPVEQILTDKF